MCQSSRSGFVLVNFFFFLPIVFVITRYWGPFWVVVVVVVTYLISYLLHSWSNKLYHYHNTYLNLYTDFPSSFSLNTCVSYVRMMYYEKASYRFSYKYIQHYKSFVTQVSNQHFRGCLRKQSSLCQNYKAFSLFNFNGVICIIRSVIL